MSSFFIFNLPIGPLLSEALEIMGIVCRSVTQHFHLNHFKFSLTQKNWKKVKLCEYFMKALYVCVHTCTQKAEGCTDNPSALPFSGSLVGLGSIPYTGVFANSHGMIFQYRLQYRQSVDTLLQSQNSSSFR
jgi:hypothetical protein